MNNDIGTYVALAALAAYLVYKAIRDRKAAPALVGAKIASGARIVDVRTPGEFSGGAFPGARNIPVDALGSRLGELPRESSIVLYCASGARSARAARMLRKAGFRDVVSAGGLSDMPRR